MAENEDRSICGVPYWIPIPGNDTASFIHDVVLCAVNVPFCVFAFLGNLVVILAVIKTPSLQRPCNILLCNICTTDCLTGLIAQPIFVAWRLMIHRIHESCDHQAELYRTFIWFITTCSGWSFVNLGLVSFDRHYALAKPLVYRSSVTKKEAVLSTVVSGTTWLMCSSLVMFILPGFYSFIVGQVLGIIFIIVPVANHIGIFIAIRRHNNQVVEAVSGNSSFIFRREKKAAIDMILVMAVLLLFFAPVIAVNIFGVFFPDKFGVLWLWCTSLLFVNSSINPVIYWVRKSEIRRAVKSMLSF